MSLQAHYAVIEEKHHKLKALVHEELLRPSPDLAMLQTLKKQNCSSKKKWNGYANWKRSGRTLPDGWLAIPTPKVALG